MNKVYIDYQELRSRVSIETVMERRGIALKRSGKEMKGLCPFHNDHNPSMTVNTEKGVWYCHVCAMGGGVIKFIQLLDNLPELNDAAIAIDRDYLGGELANQPNVRRSNNTGRVVDVTAQREIFTAGQEILRSIASAHEFMGDQQSADEIRSAIRKLDFQLDDPEASEESVRALVVYYGSNEDLQALDSIKPFASLKPTDFTDVAESRVFSSEYGDRVLYNATYGWMVYDGKRWVKSDAEARRYAQELTDRQLEDAGKAVRAAADIKVSAASSDAVSQMEDADKAAKKANDYLKFCMRRRDTTKITATMTESIPLLIVNTEDLDSQKLFLNTPSGTVNLETGKTKPHDPRDLITTITKCAPSDEGREMWEGFVMQVADNDPDLAKFLKRVAGMCLCGEVMDELLIIANGTGGNGKSTFFNAIAAAVGDYSGSINPDVLIAQENQQKRFELAGLRGKRLVLAAETDDGQHLDSGMVKRIVSTDKIRGELKHKDSFDFEPSHHLILFTNHLPVVDSGDNGTWSRLLVIPFSHVFRGKEGDKKNYASILVQKCGAAIVQWCIEGATEYLSYRNLSLNVPDCVADATEEYRNRYDLLHGWIESECETGRRCSERSSVLLESYNAFAEARGDNTINAKNFAKHIGSKGYAILHDRKGNYVKGLKLKEHAETVVQQGI